MDISKIPMACVFALGLALASCGDDSNGTGNGNGNGNGGPSRSELVEACNNACDALADCVAGTPVEEQLRNSCQQSSVDQVPPEAALSEPCAQELTDYCNCIANIECSNPDLASCTFDATVCEQ